MCDPLSFLEMKNAKAVKGTRKAKQQHGEQGFTEGWVEFMDKKVAKSVSETLNCSKIGHRKGKAFYDDLWNIKYLPKFKWHHLTDQLGKTCWCEKQAKGRLSGLFMFCRVFVS